MSVLDLSSLISLHTPEMLAPPPAPATPEIDATEMQASDANSSGTSFNSDTQSGASVGDRAAASGTVSVASRPSSPYSSQTDEAAALVLELSGASLISVEDLEQSIPPSMAAAAALLNQITADGMSPSQAAVGSLYTIIDSATALALTSAWT